MAISFKYRHKFRQNIQNQKREIVHAKELIVPLTLYKPYDYQPSKKALTQLREQF